MSAIVPPLLPRKDAAAKVPPLPLTVVRGRLQPADAPLQETQRTVAQMTSRLLCWAAEAQGTAEDFLPGVRAVRWQLFVAGVRMRDYAAPVGQRPAVSPPRLSDLDAPSEALLSLLGSHRDLQRLRLWCSLAATAQASLALRDDADARAGKAVLGLSTDWIGGRLMVRLRLPALAPFGVQFPIVNLLQFGWGHVSPRSCGSALDAVCAVGPLWAAMAAHRPGQILLAEMAQMLRRLAIEGSCPQNRRMTLYDAATQIEALCAGSGAACLRSAAAPVRSASPTPVQAPLLAGAPAMGALPQPEPAMQVSAPVRAPSPVRTRSPVAPPSPAPPTSPAPCSPPQRSPSPALSPGRGRAPSPELAPRPERAASPTPATTAAAAAPLTWAGWFADLVAGRAGGDLAWLARPAKDKDRVRLLEGLAADDLVPLVQIWRATRRRGHAKDRGGPSADALAALLLAGVLAGKNGAEQRARCALIVAELTPEERPLAWDWVLQLPPKQAEALPAAGAQALLGAWPPAPNLLLDRGAALRLAEQWLQRAPSVPAALPAWLQALAPGWQALCQERSLWPLFGRLLANLDAAAAPPAPTGGAAGQEGPLAEWIGLWLAAGQQHSTWVSTLLPLLATVAPHNPLFVPAVQQLVKNSAALTGPEAMELAALLARKAATKRPGQASARLACERQLAALLDARPEAVAALDGQQALLWRLLNEAPAASVQRALDALADKLAQEAAPQAGYAAWLSGASKHGAAGPQLQLWTRLLHQVQMTPAVYTALAEGVARCSHALCRQQHDALVVAAAAGLRAVVRAYINNLGEEGSAAQAAEQADASYKKLAVALTSESFFLPYLLAQKAHAGAAEVIFQLSHNHALFHHGLLPRWLVLGDLLEEEETLRLATTLMLRAHVGEASWDTTLGLVARSGNGEMVAWTPHAAKERARPLDQAVARVASANVRDAAAVLASQVAYRLSALSPTALQETLPGNKEPRYKALLRAIHLRNECHSWQVGERPLATLLNLLRANPEIAQECFRQVVTQVQETKPSWCGMRLSMPFAWGWLMAADTQEEQQQRVRQLAGLLGVPVDQDTPFVPPAGAHAAKESWMEVAALLQRASLVPLDGAERLLSTQQRALHTQAILHGTYLLKDHPAHWVQAVVTGLDATARAPAAARQLAEDTVAATRAGLRHIARLADADEVGFWCYFIRGAAWTLVLERPEQAQLAHRLILCVLDEAATLGPAAERAAISALWYGLLSEPQLAQAAAMTPGQENFAQELLAETERRARALRLPRPPLDKPAKFLLQAPAFAHYVRRAHFQTEQLVGRDAADTAERLLGYRKIWREGAFEAEEESLLRLTSFDYACMMPAYRQELLQALKAHAADDVELCLQMLAALSRVRPFQPVEEALADDVLAVVQKDASATLAYQVSQHAK